MTKTSEDGGHAPARPARPFLRWDQLQRTLFLRPVSGAWVVVTGVGADIIELCDGVHSPEDIAQSIARACSVTVETARRDVSDYLRRLTAAGFLRPPDRCAAPPRSLESLALHVTGQCALSCRHCYASPGDGSLAPPLELLVSAAAQARELGARSFKLTGGDPLCRPEALTALAEPMAGCEVTVLTNGLAPVDQLAALIADRGWRLQISLDGAQPSTHDWYRGSGTHARLMVNLASLAGQDLTRAVTLSVCLSRVNRGEIEAIVRQAVEWGVARVHLARISKHGRALEYWDALRLTPQQWAATYRELAELHDRYRGRVRITGVVADYVRSCLVHRNLRGCSVGRQIMMDLDGWVYPCIMLGTPEMRLGRLPTESLATCLGRVSEVRRRCSRRLEDEAICGACDWRMVCQGACPGWTLVQEGTLLGTDELCELRRDLFVQTAFGLANRDGEGTQPPAVPSGPLERALRTAAVEEPPA